MTRLVTHLQRARREEGFTLIESLVTLLIISIMLSVSVSLIGLLFDSQSKTLLQFEQQQTLQETSGFLNSRLGSTQDIGIVDGTEIDPFSVAGDQLVFRTGGTCYRIFYVQDAEQVRYKSASECNAIKPQRGPNQTGGATDPVLDNTSGSILLADNISSTPTLNSPAGSPDPLQMFTYLDADGNEINPGPSEKAGVGGSSSWYNDEANILDVVSVRVTLYMKSSASGSSGASRYFTTNIYLGQILLDSGTGSGETGPPSVSITGSDAELSSSFIPLTAEGGYTFVSRTFRTPAQLESIDPVVQEENDTLRLKTPIFPVAHSKITYNGYITFKSTTSSPVEVSIRPILMRNGGGSSTTYEPVDNTGWRTDDGGGNQNGNVVISDTGDYSTAKKLTFSGYYNIPFREATNPPDVFTGTYPADTKYYLSMRVQSVTPGSSVSYSTASTQQLLKYTITPLS